MKAKIIKKKKEEMPQNTCGDCYFSKDDTKFINRNLKGQPFMLKCPFSNWVKFHHDIACDRFISKDKVKEKEN